MAAWFGSKDNPIPPVLVKGPEPPVFRYPPPTVVIPKPPTIITADKAMIAPDVTIPQNYLIYGGISLLILLFIIK